MNGISGSESNIFIERALTWINASAHGNESVCIWGDLPPYRYAVSAFADGEAFLFSSALHHYQLLLRLAATFWGGAEFGYEQALAVAERQGAKALKLRSQPRSGRHLHRVEWHPHRFSQARTAGARCEPSPNWM